MSLFLVGPNFPVRIAKHEMVASYNKELLYTIGNTYSSNRGEIYEFSCADSIDDCKWNKTATKLLNYGRYNTVAMPIHDNALIDKLCK